MKRTAILLIGGKGRLGKLISEELQKSLEFSLTNIIGWQNSDGFLDDVIKSDVILDVSNPVATVGYLKSLMKKKKYIPYVIGCTGWDNVQFEYVLKYSKKAPVVYAPNFSTSVNLMLSILQQHSKTLADLGYTAIIDEVHHSQKKDRPSGTAKSMLERLGKIKTEIHSSRAGNIVGTHKVSFVGPHDVLTFTHEALDRRIFAIGALNASKWAAECTGKRKKFGLFSMNQILESNNKR